MLSTLPLFFGVGLLAGIMAGLFGIGGGLVIVPALLVAFRSQNIPPELTMHLALGTSLATIVVTSISSVLAHRAKGAIRWDVVSRLAPGVALGAILGAFAADFMPGALLQALFALFALIMALTMAMDFKPSAHRSLPGRSGLLVVGSVIGTLSALAGIGGGSLTVPFLSYCNVAMRYAVGIAAACGFPIALAGSAGYLLAGWGQADLPAYSTGYIYWPAFFGITVATATSAPLGARLAHRFSERRMKQLFAGFLVIVGLRLLF
ncbi:MAG: sulfite exporter TauE/SafE family protein [Pseudomonadota bacterium]|nr:sulfite exporter TauE/SafE family protein [Pseudomonadota bacterium]